MANKFDIAIIGGGPGGYVAALRARQLGLSVVLVEKDKIGGTCLNKGCIPTKTLLAEIEGLQWARRAAADGILLDVPKLNFEAIMKRKDLVLSKLITNLEKLLINSGVLLIKSRAKILDQEEVITDSKERLRARKIIIATGSKAWTPEIPGIDLPGVMDTDKILEIKKIPRTLLIIGGGVVGQEFAAIFSALGSQVIILEALDRILYGVDAEFAKRYHTLLSAQGIRIELGAKVYRIEKQPDSLRVYYERRGEDKFCETDTILVAAGRRPYFEDLFNSNLDIRVENNAIWVDQRLRTSVYGIYAIGDVIGSKMLAHLASFQGEIVAEMAAGFDSNATWEVVPACVFTHPQIAWVGPTEEEIKQLGKTYRASTFSLSANSKAMCIGEARGWIKLIEDVDTGKLIAAHMIGPHSSELIGEMVLAIRKGMSASDISMTIHPHPTISESFREASMGLQEGPIHSARNVRIYDGLSVQGKISLQGQKN